MIQSCPVSQLRLPGDAILVSWWLCSGGVASSFGQIVQHGSGLIQPDLALAARPAARAEANRGRVRPALAWIGGQCWWRG